jgi:ELWxxDGT repeat protein
LNGISIFVAGNTTSGSEVYRSDGTAAGTYLLRNINPSTSTAAATQPQNLTRAGAFVFFTADDGVHGRELWRTDGTSAGTALVRDIWIGPGGSVPSNFVAAGNRLVFTAYTPETGVEFWTSDGTPQGTFMFLDVVPGPSGANLRSVTRAGNLIYFAATVPPSLSSLWCFDWVAGAPSLLCAANYDHSAALDLQDLFDFLNDWFAGASRADTNGSGLLEVRDVFEYLQLWFSGC